MLSGRPKPKTFRIEVLYKLKTYLNSQRISTKFVHQGDPNLCIN